MLSGADQDGRTHLPGKLELTLTEGPCAGTSYAAKGPCMTVGRTRASKFHIRDPAVSEKHAEISWNGSCWQIRDTGSSNGTALNARELTAEECAPLRDGDIIRLGVDTIGTVKIEAQTCKDVTLEQLLQAQSEAMMQNIMAKAVAEAAALRADWAQHKDQDQAAAQAK